MYANCAAAGTSKKAADNACACAGDDGLVDCGGVKDGGGSRAQSPTASANADERFCIGADTFEQNKDQNTKVHTSGRSCSHGVGERERERLRMVQKEGKHRSTSIV